MLYSTSLRNGKLQSFLSLSRWNFAFHKAPECSTNQAIRESKYPSFDFLFSPTGPLLSSALTMKTTVKVALWLGNIICPAKLRMFCCSAFHCLLLYLKREAVHQTGRSQTILVFIDQYQTFKMHPEIWRHLVQSTKLSFCIFPQIFMLVLVSKMAWGVTTFRVPCSKIISIL